jgi:PAS domain S-box-containing protein
MDPTELLAPDAPFRRLAERAPIMLWISNAEGACLMLSNEWRSFRGLPDGDCVDAGWEFNIHAEDRQKAIAAFRNAHATRSPFTIEYRALCGDGLYRWVHDHGSPWFGADDSFIGLMGCCVDISDQRSNQWTAANSERRLKTLVERTQDIVYRIRLVPSLAFEYVGGAIETLTGYAPDVLYRDISLAINSVHPDDLNKLALTPEAAAHLPGTVICRWQHPDGRTVWAEHYRIPVFDAAGQITGVEGIARDITARIQGEQRLRESEEQLRQLAARLQTAREEERAEVSRELHDELGQTLTALKLEINRAVAAFASDQMSVTNVDRLQSIVGLVDVGITTVKRISARLRPATLDHLGLAEAVRWEAITFKARTGIRCQVRANREGSRLSAEQRTALFRIVQEALNNVVCHANASSVHVTITESGDAAELRIRDNGRGISAAEAAAPGSIGLLGMKERAALVGGTFKISGQRGKGTVVSVHVPLQKIQAVNRRRGHAEPKLG